MTVHLQALSFDANDPRGLARFWAGVLGWEMADDGGDGIALLPSDDTGFRLRFLQTEEPKTGPEPDALRPDQQLPRGPAGRRWRGRCALGGRHIDVGQLPEEDHVVLADPEGNEFCVIEPGNNFLADCGFIGALSCDGSQEVGYFWSKALGWPLVWDQDEETAIRSPHGGPKITWGGPPLNAEDGEEPAALRPRPPVDGDQQAEVERLLSLGATRVDIGQGDVDWVVLADPDGNEFCVLSPR